MTLLKCLLFGHIYKWSFDLPSNRVLSQDPVLSPKLTCLFPFCIIGLSLNQGPGPHFFAHSIPIVSPPDPISFSFCFWSASPLDSVLSPHVCYSILLLIQSKPLTKSIIGVFKTWYPKFRIVHFDIRMCIWNFRYGFRCRYGYLIFFFLNSNQAIKIRDNDLQW